MRKDGQPHVFKRIKLKDLYKKIKNNEISERSFKEWLLCYRYKHWSKGIDNCNNDPFLQRSSHILGKAQEK